MHDFPIFMSGSMILYKSCVQLVFSVLGKDFTSDLLKTWSLHLVGVLMLGKDFAHAWAEIQVLCSVGLAENCFSSEESVPSGLLQCPDPCDFQVLWRLRCCQPPFWRHRRSVPARAKGWVEKGSWRWGHCPTDSGGGPLGRWGGRSLSSASGKKESQATTKLVGEEEPAAKKAKISEKAPDDLELPAGSKPWTRWVTRSTT